MKGIAGVKHWKSKDVYYSQENNPTESYNKKRLTTRSYWLESCGPTAAVNCLASMGLNVKVRCPGVYEPQPEEVLMDYMNDPRNVDKLTGVRDLTGENIPGNQVPQYYPVSVYDVFGVRCSFRWGNDFTTIKDHVTHGHAVQIVLKNPGHYLAVIAYDYDRDVLLFNDSWGNRFKDGKGGHLRTLTRDEVVENVQPYMIIYGV